MSPVGLMGLGSRNDWLGVRQAPLVGVDDDAGDDEAMEQAFLGSLLRRRRLIQETVITRTLVRMRAVTTPAMIGSSVTE